MDSSHSQSAPDDMPLVLAARDGDASAMARLITRYTPMIRKASAGISAVTLDSDDKAQEGMLGFVNAVYTYSPARYSVPFGAYASVCVYNSIRSAIRRQYTAKRSADNDSVSLDDVGAGSLPAVMPPEMRIIEREQYTELLNSFFSALSPLEKKVLSLYLSGYSYSEIAQKLQITKKSADNALLRIRHKLRGLVSGSDKS